MNFNPIGDLAQNLMMRRRGNQLRQELNSLTGELASGKTRDIAKSLRGNFSTISAVEHSITLQNGYATNRKAVDQILNASQLALGAMHDSVDRIGPSLLAAATSGVEFQADPYVAEGPDLYRDMVAYANTRHGGRYVFSGVEFDAKPIDDHEVMLDNIATAVSGATTAAGFSAAIDDWFSNPSSGFNISGYTGGSPAAGALEISSSQSIEIGLTAKDSAFREALKNSAALALIERGDFSGNATEKNALLRTTASGLMGASSELLQVQAELGASQRRVKDASSQASLETQMLNTIKNEIVSVDPYETATKLEAVQTQLESLYLVTARTARLSLSEYLR